MQAEVVARRVAMGEDALMLLGWLAKRCPLELSSLPPTAYNDIQRKTGAATYDVRPDHVFAVQEREPDARSRAFDALAAQHGTITCYHGTALENFHSILMNGFLSHFNKAALFVMPAHPPTLVLFLTTVVFWLCTLPSVVV